MMVFFQLLVQRINTYAGSAMLLAALVNVSNLCTALSRCSEEK